MEGGTGATGDSISTLDAKHKFLKSSKVCITNDSNEQS